MRTTCCSPITTSATVACSSRCGLDIAITGAVDEPLAQLFAEELGAVVQVRVADLPTVREHAREAQIAINAIGAPVAGERIRIRCGELIVLDESRRDLHRAWSATTHAMQRLRDNPQAADEE